MRSLQLFRLVILAALVVVLAAGPAGAQTSMQRSEPVVSSWLTGSPAGSNKSFNLIPSGLFDPSRFSISNTMRFGYASGGYGYGGGSAGLFTSSLGYKLKPNMALQVDVGAHMNPAYGVEGMSKGIFLQGAAFSWKPSANSLFRVEYQDMRSPLQYGYSGYGYSPYSAYRSPFSGTATDPLLGDPSRN
jgi:hypothetical protein